MQVWRRPLAMTLGSAVLVAGCAQAATDSSAPEPVADDQPDDVASPVDDAEGPEAAGDEAAPERGDQGTAPEEEPAADPADEAQAAAVDASGADLTSCGALPGYAEVDPDTLTSGLLDTLAAPAGASRADADLGPLTKAVLLVEAIEEELPRVRYRVRYGTELRDRPPAADPVPVSSVQVDRFNLGPAMHEQLVTDLGADAVGDVTDFGVGPHVSYCLQLQPLTGMTADVFEASRAELSPDVADGAECLGSGSCTGLASIPEAAVDWEDTGEVPMVTGTPYEPIRGGVPSPAAGIDLALISAGVATAGAGGVQWSGFEPREGVAPGAPFVELVLETGLGQDDGIDVALREGHVMDHTMEAAWQRIVGFPSSTPGEPVVFGAWSSEDRPAG